MDVCYIILFQKYSKYHYSYLSNVLLIQLYYNLNETVTWLPGKSHIYSYMHMYIYIYI